LSAGGIVLIADLSDIGIGNPASAVVYGNDVLVGAATKYAVVSFNAYKDASAQVLSTGRFDYGYLGLPKLVHTATVVVNSEIDTGAGQQVLVGYSLDGGSVTWLSDDFVSGGTQTWDVSTSAGGSVIGIEVEWHVSVKTINVGVVGTSDGATPKVVSLYSDVSGARSRIEWQVAIDVGESSVSDGSDVLAALNLLKTSHGVVEWSDPFEVDVYTLPETYDVRVLDVSLPELTDDGLAFALVRFQTVGVVG
jgi:hypothetical protein